MHDMHDGHGMCMHIVCIGDATEFTSCIGGAVTGYEFKIVRHGAASG